MFAAWNGDTPLAAALIGWGNGRAFYIMGGSTPEGYEAGASVWLHWRIINQLAESRFTHYNLGGASPTASNADDPAHGLYRFKTAFGARIVPCRSLYWTLSVSHARLHQLARWIATQPSDRET
jgi:lipid II:glycine glycyltransferase (peptidoglycan interpeptide bridge formation enzyme)